MYVSLICSPGVAGDEGGCFLFKERIEARPTGAFNYMVDGRVFRRSSTSRGVTVKVDVDAKPVPWSSRFNPGGPPRPAPPQLRQTLWTFRFEAPTGQPLNVGDYRGATRIDIEGEAPELDYSGPIPLASVDRGRFVVWEVEFAGNELKRLAIDFVANGRPNGNDVPPVFGMIRYNSTFD
jgi:hypothetical protein